MMVAKAIRAEYKRRRTVAIKKLREAGLSEAEIQEELAKIRESLGISGESAETSDNLPAVIEPRNDSADRRGSARDKSKQYPKKPNRDEFNRSTDAENVARHDEKLANNPERRCVATNQLGERCRNWAVHGARVCKYHGGSTRHIKEKARIRLEMASNRLVGKLVEIAFDDTRPAAVQLDAIKDSLNRAGLTKPAQVEVGPIKPFDTVFDSITSERVDSGIDRVDYQHDSEPLASSDETGSYDSFDSIPPTQREPRTQTQPTSTEQAGSRDRPDFEPLSAEDRRVRRDRDRYHRPSHITGEDAYQAANEANRQIGALRALPPGRSDLL